MLVNRTRRRKKFLELAIWEVFYRRKRGLMNVDKQHVQQQLCSGCLENEDRRPKTKDLEEGRPPRKRRPRKGRPPRKRRPRKGRPPRKRRPRKGRPPRKTRKHKTTN